MSGARGRLRKRLPRGSHIYSMLIRSLLPEELRRAHGCQMQETFARLRHDARASAGVRGELAVWWREVSQLYAVGRWERGRPDRPEAAGGREGGRPARPAFSPAGGASGAGGFDRFRFNLRQGLRGLRRSPALAATVVVTLALGIGANATMFGVIDRILLQAPEHIVDADRVVRLYVHRGLGERQITTPGITYPDFADLTPARQLAATAAYSTQRITVGHGDGAERARGALTTPSFFSLLGVRPLLGRFPRDDDDVEGSASVAVLGYEFWRRRGGDPEVVGTPIRLGGVPHTVIGVAPAGFTGADLQRVDVWLPLRSPANPAGPASLWEGSRGFYWLRAIARIADGATVQSAEEEATALHRTGRADDEHYDPEASVMMGSVVEARGPQRSGESVVARWLTGVSSVVLLVACANVANMLLARGMRRRRETGVRLALGVSRGQLITQQLTESLLLALPGGLAALGVAHWGAIIVRAVLLPDIHWPGAPLNPRVLLFTFAAALASGLVAGIVPALQATRHDVVNVLRGGAVEGGRSGSRARFALLVSQASLSVVLLVGAGLFVKSIGRVQSMDLGYDADRLLVAVPEFDDDSMPREQLVSFYDAALQRLGALPAVEGVAASAALPFYWSLGTSFVIPGREELPSFSDGGPYVYPVTDDYFATAGIRIVRGRGFVAADDAAAERVMVVGENLAETYWPGEDPLGKCVHVNREEDCTRVVGIAEPVNRGSFTNRSSGQYYVPISQWREAFSPRFVVVRSLPGGFDELIPAVHREMQGISPAVRFVNVRAFRDLIDPSARSWRLGATLFSAFGAVALAIASLGLYGVLSFSVAQRRSEIGIRSALGASAGGLIALVVLQAMRLVAAGLALGIAAALAAGPYLEPMLFEVDPHDPSVIAAVALVLAVVGVIAATIPALRAARVDPVIALRRV